MTPISPTQTPLALDAALSAAQTRPGGAAPDEAALRRAAQDFETMFLSEMLRMAGLHKTPESFSGGAGENAFQSLLIREQAAAISESGAFGLAERIYEDLKRGASHAQ